MIQMPNNRRMDKLIVAYSHTLVFLSYEVNELLKKHNDLDESPKYFAEQK